MTLQVAVVGAGVVGCTTALSLYDTLRSDVAVTVFAEKFSPHTTSDKSGAIMIPFDVTSTVADNARLNDNIKKWTRASFEFFKKLHGSKDAGSVDIQLVSGYYGDDDIDKHPWWSDLMLGFREVGMQERMQVNIPGSISRVFAFSTYIINCRKLLPWMMEKIKERGGCFIPKKITDLSELNDYDVVINCTGLGSYELIGDRTLYPVHGDVALVTAPWIKEFFLLTNKQSYTYIFPRSNDVVLGGSGRRDDWSELPDEKSLEALKDRCTSLIPSLAHAKIVKTWAGLRPARNIIRVEKDSVQIDKPLIIHCYGHGGQGVLLAWGCAVNVCEIVTENLKKKRLTSKF